jgi:hypothetical protein
MRKVSRFGLAAREGEESFRLIWVVLLAGCVWESYQKSIFVSLFACLCGERGEGKLSENFDDNYGICSRAWQSLFWHWYAVNIPVMHKSNTVKSSQFFIFSQSNFLAIKFCAVGWWTFDCRRHDKVDEDFDGSWEGAVHFVDWSF